MAKKPLPTPDALRQLLRYDPDTGDLFWRERPEGMFTSRRIARSWNSTFAGKKAGNQKPNGYRYLRIFNRPLYAHRIAYAMSYGRWPAHQVDHIDGDRGNNALVNLRDCTNAENSRNSKLFSTNTSGHCGVTWDKQTSKWLAQARVNGKQYSLGRHDRLEDAVAARTIFERRTGAFTDRHGVAVTQDRLAHLLEQGETE